MELRDVSEDAVTNRRKERIEGVQCSFRSPFAVGKELRVRNRLASTNDA
jgi:hypothetical protein